jgi:CubicO group peptidase (beta-lactamase class C family)
LIDVDAPAAVEAWAGDERRHITVRQLLQMTSGLEFVEDYVDVGVSHVIEMLFGSGADDHAAYAASFPLIHQPGTVWNYSSGTTNILARIAGDLIGGGQAGMEHYLHQRLFSPLGMSSAQPKFDAAGTFVGSSYVYATARDFARYGYLHLHDGIWNDTQLLPDGWVDAAQRPVSVPLPDDETHGYGEHWWHWRHDPTVLMASGYEMQRIIIEPARDLVLVRLGKTPAESAAGVDAWLDDVRHCFPTHD